MTGNDLKKYLLNGRLDDRLSKVYGKNFLMAQRNRYIKALDSFDNSFGDGEVQILSVPGRSEVGGNHTDHNAGCVLACSVNLDLIAIARKMDTQSIRIQSSGFPPDEIDIHDLSVHLEERFTSKALIRGIVFRVKELGFTVGGFDAYMTSDVLKGSGLSSSAAYEVMCCNILSNLYNGGKTDALAMAGTGQFAESEYYGKPCGSMDQTACAVGGFIGIDFQTPEIPCIEKVNFNLVDSGYTLCVVNTAGSHAGMNEDYAAVQYEMKSVAAFLGHSVLRECNENDFYTRLPEIRKSLGDRAVLRSIHFFEENKRVEKEIRALKESKIDAFLAYVNQSGRSSMEFLQNGYSLKNYREQGLCLALALSERILAGRGACRVHGGGFAGTIQAFVPNDLTGIYAKEMNRVFGENSCIKLFVRPEGAVRLI